MVRNMMRFYGEELLAHRPTPSPPFRLSATAYSIYSQLATGYGLGSPGIESR